MAQSTITSATPGNIVVPLSAIIDQLQGKMSAADLNALLLAVVGQKRNDVRPGDLITAELINQILSDIEDLNQRVAILESTASTSGPRIIRIDGPLPIRVGSRVTVVGENFSVPATRNGVFIDTTSAAPINSASSATQIVFDMPDPGIGQTGRLVTLKVTNADSLTASFMFQLQPALNIPHGTLAVNYVQPPANSGTSMQPGVYDFGFKLLASVDQNAQVLLSATSSESAWTTTVIDPLTFLPITEPILLSTALGTHFERNFLVRVTAPSTGATSARIDVAATEVTPGTQVNPALTQTLNLVLTQPVPAPENRVTVDLLSTSSNVTFNGGTAVFTRNQFGQIDFEIILSNLGANTGGTSFALSATLDPPGTTAWQLGPLSQAAISVTGPGGTGRTSALVQPPNAASAAALLLTISGTPLGQSPVNVTCRVPLRTN